MTSGPDWVRLGRYVTARRVALGMTSVRALAEATREISTRGISERSLGKLENGRSEAYRSTLAAVEIALKWAPGSAQAILEGGEPVETNRPGTSADPSYRAILDAPGLTDGEKLDAIAAIEERRSRMAAAGFTERQARALRDAPEAYKVLMDRQRQKEKDEADGEPASGDRPA